MSSPLALVAQSSVGSAAESIATDAIRRDHETRAYVVVVGTQSDTLAEQSIEVRYAL